MFLFFLSIMILVSSLQVYVGNSTSSFCIKYKRAIFFTSLIILYFGLMLCSNYLASVGIPFSQSTESIDFSQTISSGYIGHFIQISVIFGIIIYAYLYARKYLKVPQYILIAAIGISALLIYFPGIPYADTNDLYNYFLTGQYSDWQPPLYTLSWHVFGFYGAAFLANIISYYAGLSIISYYLYRNKRNWQNDLLVLFSINPILFSQLNIVLKETLFAGLLIDCIAIYLLVNLINHKTIKIFLYIVYFIFIFIVIGIRYNAIIAVIPFIWLILDPILRKYDNKKKIIFQIALTLLVTILLGKANIWVAYNVFNAKKAYSPTIVMFNDLVNIECKSNHQFKIPNELFTDQAKIEELRDNMCNPQISNEFNYDPIFIANWNGIGNPAILKYDQTKETYEVAKKAWVSAIISHPWSYLIYRSRFFANDLLGQYYMPAFAPSSFGSWPKDVAQPSPDSLQIKVQQFIAEISLMQRFDMRYILGFFILIANFTMLMYYILSKNLSLSWCIYLSNILTLASLFLVEGEHPARYFLWSNIATLLTIILTGFSEANKNEQQ